MFSSLPLLPTWCRPYRRPGLLALLLWLLAAPAAWATHLVGGQLDLQHQAGSSYQLTLTLYFDAVNGDPAALDSVLVAGIFDKAGGRQLASVRLPLTSNTFVAYTNPACAIGSLSTRKLLYVRNITLDPTSYASAQGYYVAVERCCRNAGISNIVSPGAAAQTFYLEFPAVVRGGQPFLDSTPRLFPALGDYACLGTAFAYDFGGQDADGDSLAYDMVTPLNGHATALHPSPAPVAAPYATVAWLPGFSAAAQIPGSPALGINARTGQLTVQPSRVGLFVFGVRCTEYRGGVKIGETRRDYQLYVLNCPRNSPPVATVQANGRRYQAGRDTVRLLPGGPRCLTVRYTDPDANSTLTLGVRPVNFTDAGAAPSFTTSTSGTVRATGQPDTLTATLCFPACADTRGRVYLLDVLVADNGCALPKRDTVRVAFTAAPPAATVPVLTTSFPLSPASDTATVLVRVPLGQPYTATLLGTDPAPNPLTLSAAGLGFSLPAVGMSFAAQNGAGRAAGTFSWLPACGPAATPDGLRVRFTLTQAAPCTPQVLTRTVRFQVVPAGGEVAFRPPNVITPNGDGLNERFTLPDLPPDFCDAQFAGVQIFSRWGRLLYQSGSRSFSWGGAGVAATYYYLVTYTDGRRYKGWLEVIP